MQLYRWRARNKSGKIFSGQLLAGSDREVAEYVQERHGYVINIKKTNNWYNYKQKFLGRKVNAKSIMGMMTLGLAAGDSVIVEIDGKDEQIALESIEKYLSGKL